MDGFSFPPPPPPPPRATSSLQQEAPSQFNSRGGGRGGRASGRATFRGSRGSAPQRRGGGRNQHPQQQYQNQNPPNSAAYGQPHQNNHPQPFQAPSHQHYQTPQQQYQTPQQYQTSQQYPPLQHFSAPPGSYVNPSFNGALQSYTYPHLQPPQYGQHPPPPPSQATYNNANFAPVSKRTRDQAFGGNNPHPMKKPQSAPKAPVAPAVPSFGAPILPQKPVTTTSLTPSTGPTRQRNTASLGLIPPMHNSPGNPDNEHHPKVDNDVQEDDDNDEEEEEVDEEAALSSLQNGPLSFEFNGELSTLSSSAEIAEWIAERKKRWPSHRRVAEKQHQVQERMNERRRIEHETRAAIASASGGVERLLPDKRQLHQDETPPLTTTIVDQQSTLNAARQSLAVEQTHQQHTPDAPAQNANSKDDDDDDSDAAPEEASSKPSQPIRVPPPTRQLRAQQQQHQKHHQGELKQCISFVNQGRCKFGNKCRYKHDASTNNQQKNKRKTLYQRLVEQEMDEENRLAVQAIKYLGGAGFFSKHASSSAA